VNIKQIIATIKQMQADGIIGQYAVGGAVAATFYPVEPDMTYDVDIFIALNPAHGQSLISLDPIFTWFRSRGFRVDNTGSVMIGDVPVQFLTPPTPLVLEALRSAVERDIDGELIRVFTLEHLAAIAFQLGRPKDRTRVVRFLDSKEFDGSRFSKILELHGLQDSWAEFKKNVLD
jgi:hypothetical protein